MKILLKLPSRERANRFFGAIDNIIENVSSENYTILATLDNDDPAMNNMEVLKRLATYPKLSAYYGDSISKVDAINRDMNKAGEWDILCLHSDDMFFTKKGFDEDIREAMRANFPDTDGMLHFPDQKQETRNTCTYHIIGRKYYDRQGYIYHPDYTSLWADDHETQKAKMLGKYAFIDKQILEHRHPVWGYGEYDSLLRKTQRFYKSDKQVFLRHQANNFDIQP